MLNLGIEENLDIYNEGNAVALLSFWLKNVFGMRKYTVIIFAFIALLACKSEPSTTDTPFDGNTLLYKIEGNNIQPSYLFGTIHLLPQEDFELETKVEDAFEQADKLVLEIDMDDPKLQQEMMKYSMMPGDLSIEQFLSEEDYARLDAELKASSGMGLEAVKKMKPFMLYSMLMTKYMGEQVASFELEFVQMAIKMQKEVLGLEEIKEQFAVFDSIPYEQQVEDIVEMMNEEDKTKDIFRNMIELYKAEDVEGLYNTFGEYYKENPREIELLLHQRNRNWIARIGELAKDKKVFFGVGAGHLGGEQGVLNLLRQAGYTVQPIGG